MTDETKDILPRSPSVAHRVLEHKIEMENKEIDNTWRSMCLVVNKNAVQYFTQIFIICGIMIFAIYKLLTDDNCQSQQAYMGLLTLLIGLVIPQPTFK